MPRARKREHATSRAESPRHIARAEWLEEAQGKPTSRRRNHDRRLEPSERLPYEIERRVHHASCTCSSDACSNTTCLSYESARVLHLDGQVRCILTHKANYDVGALSIVDKSEVIRHQTDEKTLVQPTGVQLIDRFGSIERAEIDRHGVQRR